MLKIIYFFSFFFFFQVGATAQTVSTYKKDVWDVARNGSVSDMQALMKLKADTINAVNKNGFTPLLLACYRGNQMVAEFLMPLVKDINANSREGTALMACTFGGDSTLMRLLLKFGADINGIDAEGNTALILAAQTNQASPLALLLREGANKNKKNNEGKTAMDFALFNNYKTIITLLK